MLPRSLRPRALVAVLAAAAVATSCGNVVHPAAAVVDGVRISDGQLRATIPAFRFIASLRQLPCGQAGPGETASSACTRFALAELVQGQAARNYAAAHDVALPNGELANVLTSVEQRFGGHAQLLHQLAVAHVGYPQLSTLVETILLVERVATAVTAQVVPVQELEQRYQQERLRFTLLHVAHILVKTKRLAERIARTVTARNFASLARKYSIDPTGKQGGDLGVNRATSLDPTFVQAALSLRPGQISGPVHTRFGWHVIRLLAVRLIPFDRARQALLLEFAAQGFTTWLGHDAGSIDVNPRYGRFDPRTGRIDAVCSTSATEPCPSSTPPPPGLP